MPRTRKPATRLLSRAEGVATLDALEPRCLLAFNPTADEQYMLELVNRFRAAPREELGLLTTSLGQPARSQDGPTDSALRFFGTSGPVLASQFSTLTPAPPLAWNSALYLAAERHNGQMIAFDEQSHQLPGEPGLGDRATLAGYTNWSSLGENVFAFARSVFHGHTGFVLDWGDTPTGIQQPPGHRDAMLSPSYREIGIRITDVGFRQGKQTGPLVISQEFGRRFTQGDAFLLGVVYGDTSSDGYTPGEGFGGVSVSIASELSPALAPVITTTMSAGGWQAQVPPGTYSVTFSGAGFGSPVTYRNVVVGTQNVKLDAVKGVTPPEPDIQLWGNGSLIASGDSAPNLFDLTNFGPANVGRQSVERELAVYNAGDRALTLSGLFRVRITGPAAGDFAVVSDASSRLDPSAASPFRVRFTPTAQGLRQATVTIVSNDPDTPVYTFAVSGRGVLRPAVGVTGKGVAIVNNDPSPSVADGTRLGSANAFMGRLDREFRIVNTGLSGLRFTGSEPVRIESSWPGSFTVVSQPSGVVPPGGSVPLIIRFSPEATGLLTARVVVSTRDPATPEHAFWVQGTGRAAPRMVVTGAGLVISRDDATPTIADRSNFGQRAAGVNERLRVFTITNTGLGVLRLNAFSPVRISGVDAADFALARGPLALALNRGESTTILVRFAPLAPGVRSGAIEIVSNDALGDYRFAIAGLGV
jgi:hypothetical protein